MLRLDVSDHIAVVTIDNPPVNAQPLEFMARVMEIFDSLSDRDDVRVAILTGTGKMFSAGADLKNRPGPDAPPGTMWGRMRMAREAMYSIMECRKPVIAAINGPAIGAGFGIAAVCDILVASDNAYLSLPEIDVGLMGGARHAMRLFPHSLVSRMVLTGLRVGGAELYRRGVTEACLPVDELMPYCMDLAATIAAKSPMAIGLAKDALTTVGNLSIRDGYRYEQSNTVRLSRTEDAVEARTAVLEKRAPVWKGAKPVPFADNGGVRLFYEAFGEASAPAVLLLNGAGKQGPDLPDAFREAIAACGFFVVRFDQRDTGLSTGFAEAGTAAAATAVAVAEGHAPVLPYTAADLAADAFAVLDALDVDRAHLFGRSLGSYVAQVMVLDAPGRIASLTLAMPFSRAIGTGMPRERLDRLDAEVFADAAAFADRQVATARAVGNPDYFDEGAIRAAAVQAFARGVPAGSIARHFMVGLAAPDLRERLVGVAVPVQLIHGRRDTVIPLALARETEAAIPGARLTLLDDMAHEGPPQLWQRWIELFVANAARG